MQVIAESQGFRSEILLTASATREATLSAISRASAVLEPGDFLFLTYSGHGGQLPDHTGDEIDGLDETWCLSDGQLVDDELYAALAAVAGGVRGGTGLCVIDDLHALQIVCQ
jgi:hypothetical protein